jgi:hypothetical protein
MSKYAKEYYDVPSDIGRRVIVNGKPGIIAVDRGNYIGVNFDAHKPGVICNCHPTSGVQYLEMGAIRKMTKAQARYRRWLEVSDCFENFKAFLLYETAKIRCL